MRFKEFLKNFYTGVKEGISRFPVAFICSILCFLTASYQIIFESDTFKIFIPLYLTYALVSVFSVLLKTAQEYITEKINSLLQYILCAIVAVAGFFLLKIHYESLYAIMAYTGIMIALLCFIFFTLMRGENKDTAFPKLISSLVFANAICGVLSGGLSICLAAFESLIFSWNDFSKLYFIINLFVWVVCFINIFLSFIPKKDVPLPQSKIFRTFVLFAGLPLYILLIAILLVYLAKIVITWNMPVGEINWFASFASLFFIFFLLSVKQYTEKIAKMFVKFGGYFLIPVLIMQAIAVFERINAYGLTTPRTVSLVLIIISILFIAGSLIMPKHLNKIALVSGIIVLIVTVTPFNVIDMPVASQTKILESVLTANGMLKDGKVVPNSKVSVEDAEKIISSYNYLKYDAKKLPEFILNSEKNTDYEIFGFKADHDSDRNNYIHCNFSTKESVDITDYNKMVECREYDSIKIEHNGQQYDIDLEQLARNFYSQYGDEEKQLDIYVVDDNLALYFTNFNVSFENDQMTYCYFNGYALLKD